MRRRRRRLWPWLIVAVAAATAVWLAFGPRGSSSIPVPGRALSTPAPSERITDGDRRELERILQERGRTK